MEKQQKKWITITAGICCCLIVIVFLVNPMIILPIGGPVPMEIRTARSYLHTDDVILDDGLQRTVFRKTGNVMTGKPPIFPDLSPYTSSVFHTREGSDDLYLTVVWYFIDQDTFLDNRDGLNTFYLERYGNLSATSLTFEYDEPGNSGNPQHRTNSISVTGFENNITSGYFTTIQHPESKKPDFSIVYYGTVKSGNLSRQTPYLKKIMKRFFDPASDGSTVIPVWTPSPDVTARLPGVNAENASAIKLLKFSRSIDEFQPSGEFLEYMNTPVITRNEKDQCQRLIADSKGFEKLRDISQGPTSVVWAYPYTGKLRISAVVGSETSDIYGLYYADVDPESDSILDEGFVDWKKYW